jgi:cytosine/adenosine deaminase-related metal-dependent hydrolase
MSLYLTDARFVDWRTLEITRGHLRVDEGPAGGVATVDAVPAGATVVDCAGRLVTRAFAIGHHHVYSTLARGMPAPARTPRSFVEILELIWWKLDSALDEAMIRASALACAVEAARCGCTFVVDHHASPDAVEGSLGLIAEAFDRVGVSHLLCYELSDRDGPGPRDAGFAETERHLRERPGLVGLHASFTVSDELLERAVDLARRFDTGVHVHVAEAESDEAHCRATHGCSVAERLRRAGALDAPATILAHCLHLDDDERRIVRGSAAWVVHNTQSNQNNAVGQFDPRGLGDRIFTGTDGMHSDPLAGARAMYLEGRAVSGLAPLDAYRRLRRVHEYLERNGVPGDGENNLVVLDYPTPTPVTRENWPAHVVYGLAAGHVRTVISNGAVIVDEGRVQTVDEAAILAEAREQAARLWKRL